MTTYPEPIVRALRESGERETAKQRDALRTARVCGWCLQPKEPGSVCCGSEPWRNQ